LVVKLSQKLIGNFFNHFSDFIAAYRLLKAGANVLFVDEFPKLGRVEGRHDHKFGLD
jgi:hypothetical protein